MSSSDRVELPNDQAIRKAFGHVATNVAVITVADHAGLHGCTANAWAEAPDPPLVLVTLRRGGETGRRIAAARRLGVNVLAGGQEELARTFAGRGDRFAHLRHRAGSVLGQPILTGALVSFECELQAIHDFGAQDIYIALVRNIIPGIPSAGPLLFFDRRFHRGDGERDAGR